MTSGFGSLVISRLRDRLQKERGRATELVKGASFSRATLQNWLNGTSQPSLDDVDEIAGRLGIPVQELVGVGASTRESLIGAIVLAVGDLNDEAKLRLALDHVRTLGNPDVLMKGAAHHEKRK